jgi:hypothetical protein
MKELSKEEILEVFKKHASSPRYRLSELEIFTLAIRWMEEQNKPYIELLEEVFPHVDEWNFPITLQSRMAKALRIKCDTE